MQKQIILACALVFSGFLAQAQAPSSISTTPSAQPNTKAAPVRETITSGQGKSKTKPTNRTKTVTKNNDGSKTVQITKANGQGTVQVTKIKPPKTKKTEPKVTRIREDREKQ